ncbi:hypothetical protein AJ79_05827 [Helicocarpus griseus UAMH5409]|uniref:Uncharacterized protein n=1 Tax=Helicocarpus griseus UAMH5409 TaxID=1447875 RepID=A0A2B7XJ82_9EURO|nr:hypothetical protein AJ79_05827 [Helicocarpus griseus UAMH5409]
MFAPNEHSELVAYEHPLVKEVLDQGSTSHHYTDQTLGSQIASLFMGGILQPQPQHHRMMFLGPSETPQGLLFVEADAGNFASISRPARGGVVN